MKDILLLTDYKGNFGSKWNAKPYRSGMDLGLIKKRLNDSGYNVLIKSFADFNFNNKENINFNILYTSSEDNEYIYKDYIEDIVLGAEVMGANVIPSYKFLRANNNKVFMEILRDNLIPDNNLKSYYVSVLDDKFISKINYPIIMKESSGAMSAGVSKIENKNALISNIKKLNKRENLNNFKGYIKDKLRVKKHKNYIPESPYRTKFVLQEMVPNLTSDYKVLVFGKRYYIFERPIRKNDFRASGSGNKNYIYGSKVNVSKDIFDYAEEIFKSLSIPNVSLDICDDNKNYLLFEFQALYFGSVGQFKSDGYYQKNNNKWEFISEKLELEEVYADSIVEYLNK
mgnify:CR=1 FL=1